MFLSQRQRRGDGLEPREQRLHGRLRVAARLDAERVHELRLREARRVHAVRLRVAPLDREPRALAAVALRPRGGRDLAVLGADVGCPMLCELFFCCLEPRLMDWRAGPNSNPACVAGDGLWVGVT